MWTLSLPERVAIVGSRAFSDLGMVRAFVALLPVDTIVISGGAPGVDEAAESSARDRGLQVEIYYADWIAQPRRAGELRNSVVVHHSEHLVAFWDGISPGTVDVVGKARREGVSFTVFRVGGLLPIVEAAR